MLQVLPALETGGVERGTVEIAEAIAAAGGRALVTSSGGRMVARLEGVGGHHIALPLAAKNPAQILANAARLRRLIRAEGVRIVHVRSRAPGWSAWAAARTAGVRLVTTYHGIYQENLPAKRLYNSVMARGDLVIAISRYVAAHLTARHGIDPRNVRVIPRGVDTRAFDPDSVAPERVARLRAAWNLPADRAVVMLPARLSRWKGQDVLIEALGQIAARDAVAVLVGADQGRARYVAGLRARAAALGVADRLIFAGHCDDMPAALLLADVVVSASVQPEAFGRAVIEAQAMARPVIATDHGGAAETVEAGVSGWRVPPGDADALARALDRTLAMPAEARTAFGCQARESVLRRYTTAAMQAATLAVYRELLRNPRP